MSLVSGELLNLANWSLSLLIGLEIFSRFDLGVDVTLDLLLSEREQYDGRASESWRVRWKARMTDLRLEVGEEAVTALCEATAPWERTCRAVRPTFESWKM